MRRVKHAGDSALLLELEPVIDSEVNAQAIGIAAHLRQLSLAGVRDVVPTFRSVAVYFDPLRVDADALRQALVGAPSGAGPVHTPRTIEVPVDYGGEAGPDLADVAAFASLSEEQVIARHTSPTYRVFMLGFLPGFAYLGSVPDEIASPRREVPRLRVPAGSVGIAGRQTAVYPRDSPGGWQIIGRTELPVFDATRIPPNVFVPGDRVRFVQRPRTPRADASADEGSGTRPSDAPPAAGIAGHHRRAVSVLRPGLFSTVQDLGRWGHQSLGVPVSGALDQFSHRFANALVGNPAGEATLEVTIVGPELRIEADSTIAITGADLSPSIGDATVALNTPFRCDRGNVLRFGVRRSGGRAYVAFSGGICSPPVLGSRATHALTALGGVAGRALRAGDTLPLGDAGGASSRARAIAEPVRVTGGVRVRVLRGPQDDFFSDDTFDALQRHRFTVGTNSDRMGYRLQGARLHRRDDREMISDATFTGAIQVPASGEPILLMADRQTTGGYPQIATVITADIPLAAQLVPGDWIEFELCSRAEALSALVAQEGKLLAV
jgi:KipI family sensor histidine kinase inhibitor